MSAQARRYYERGKQALDSGDLETAQQQLRERAPARAEFRQRDRAPMRSRSRRPATARARRGAAHRHSARVVARSRRQRCTRRSATCSSLGGDFFGAEDAFNAAAQTPGFEARVASGLARVYCAARPLPRHGASARARGDAEEVARLDPRSRSRGQCIDGAGETACRPSACPSPRRDRRRHHRRHRPRRPRRFHRRWPRGPPPFRVHRRRRPSRHQRQLRAGTQTWSSCHPRPPAPIAVVPPPPLPLAPFAAMMPVTSIAGASRPTRPPEPPPPPPDLMPLAAEPAPEAKMLPVIGDRRSRDQVHRAAARAGDAARDGACRTAISAGTSAAHERRILDGGRRACCREGRVAAASVAALGRVRTTAAAARARGVRARRCRGRTRREVRTAARRAPAFACSRRRAAGHGDRVGRDEHEGSGTRRVHGRVDRDLRGRDHA